ncbi:hypothetical protein U1Q18_038722 [Sarracenia purpurea var. burkii]
MELLSGDDDACKSVYEALASVLSSSVLASFPPGHQRAAISNDLEGFGEARRRVEDLKSQRQRALGLQARRRRRKEAHRRDHRRRKKKFQEICDPVKPEVAGVVEVQLEEDDRQRNEKRNCRGVVFFVSVQVKKRNPGYFSGVATGFWFRRRRVQVSGLGGRRSRLSGVAEGTLSVETWSFTSDMIPVQR